MLTIRRATDVGLQTIDRPLDGSWVEVANSKPEEASTLSQDYGIPLGFLRPIFKFDSLPRTERAAGALLILVRIPFFQGAAATIPYITLPLGIFLTGNSVITICSRAPDLLRDFPEEQRAQLSPAKPNHFILCLLWSVANSYLRYLADINVVVDQLESRLQRSLENKEVMELLRYQKSLVHFATALRTNAYMLERLERSHFLRFKSPDDDLLDDVMTEYREAIEMVGIASDILSQMMDSFTSIIANNLNVVLKFMTAVTVILMVPGTVAAFYGMNVRLPLEDSPFAFVSLVGLSVGLAVLIGLFFRKKNWL